MTTRAWLLTAVAVLGALSACSSDDRNGDGGGEADRGQPRIEAQPVRWDGPILVPDALPDGFPAEPEVFLDESPGDGWSTSGGPGRTGDGVWHYAGAAIPDLLDATGAREIGTDDREGVEVTRYRVEAEKVAEVIETAAGGRPPRGIDGGLMEVATRGERMRVRVELGLDVDTLEQLRLENLAGIVTSVGAVDPRLASSLRLPGIDGCPDVCASVGGPVEDVGDHEGADQLRLLWATPDSAWSVSSHPLPCPSPDAGLGDMEGFGGANPFAGRSIAVDGADIPLSELAFRAGQPTQVLAGPVPEGITSATGFCMATADGGSANVWTVGEAVTDEDLVRFAESLRAATQAERDALSARAERASGLVGISGTHPATTALVVPDPPPAGDPGDVLVREEIRLSEPDGRRDYAVAYLSTGANGEPMVDTARVSVPEEVAPSAPVVVSGHGTRGQGDGCTGVASTSTEPVVEAPVDGADDWVPDDAVLVTPDFRGAGGTPGAHPYLDPETLARSILDSARAARDFGGDGPVVLRGFSEGAAAVLHAAARQPSYAPELDIRGVIANGVPSRVVDAYAYIDVLFGAGAYLGDIVFGLAAARPDLDPSTLLDADGLAWLELGLKAEPNPFCGQRPPGFDPAWLLADPAQVPGWNDAFAATNPDRIAIEVPVVLISNAEDFTTPPVLAQEVCHNLGRLGTDVQHWTYATGGHGGLLEARVDEARWLESALDGGPALPAEFEGPAPEVATDCPAPDIAPPG